MSDEYESGRRGDAPMQVRPGWNSGDYSQGRLVRSLEEQRQLNSNSKQLTYGGRTGYPGRATPESFGLLVLLAVGVILVWPLLERIGFPRLLVQTLTFLA